MPRILNVTADARTFVLMLMFLTPLKAWHTWGRMVSGETGIDGGYYLDIAQNIRDGLGFVTDVSPFHQGLPYFPHPSPVYPLWPLLLGWCGRIVPLEVLPYGLNFGFYLAVLFLAWRLGKLLFPDARARGWGLELNGGIALAAIFGFHKHFFGVTSQVYTEGFSYTLLLLALLRSLKILRQPAARGGLELGVWAGLLFLCRSQLLVFFMGGLAAFAWLAWTAGRRSGLVPAAVYLASFFAVIVPEILFVKTIGTENPFWVYFRFDQFQATPVLPPFRPLVETHGVVELLQDRLHGVLRAFSRDGYFRAYRLFAFAIPLALPGLITEAYQLRKASLPEWVSARMPQLFLTAFALVGILSVHAVHMKSGRVWFFGARQGLAAALAIWLANAWLLSRRGWPRLAAVAIFVISVSLAGRAFVAEVKRANRPHRGFVASNSRLIERLNQAAPGAARTVIAVPSDMGKRLAPWVPGGGFQEYFKGEVFARMDDFSDRLGVTHWVVASSAWEKATEADRSRFLMRFRKLAGNLGKYDFFGPVEAE